MWLSGNCRAVAHGGGRRMCGAGDRSDRRAMEGAAGAARAGARLQRLVDSLYASCAMKCASASTRWDAAHQPLFGSAATTESRSIVNR